MFEAKLKEKVQNIFGIKRVTFSTFGEFGGFEKNDPRDQEAIYISISEATSTIKEGVAHSRVTGRCSIFGNSDKIPYAFFAKRIQAASLEDVKDFFFYDVDKNSNLFGNISERSFAFLFLFSSQYDPNHGTLNSIEVTS